jgi:hypothetical protein
VVRVVVVLVLERVFVVGGTHFSVFRFKNSILFAYFLSGSKPCDGGYPVGSFDLASAVAAGRQGVSRKHYNKAWGIGLEHGTSPSDMAPFKNELSEYGQEG